MTSMTQILWKHYFRNLQRNTRMCVFQSICSFSECNWHSGWVMLSEIKLHARGCGYIYLLLVNTKGVAFRMLRTLARLCSWPSLAGSSPPPEPENGQYPLPLDPLPPIMGRRTFSSWSGHTWDRRTNLEDKRTYGYLTHIVKYLHTGIMNLIMSVIIKYGYFLWHGKPVICAFPPSQTPNPS